MQNNLLTVGEAAELLGVTKTTLRNWDKAKKLIPKRHPMNDYREYEMCKLKAVKEMPTAKLTGKINYFELKKLADELKEFLVSVASFYQDGALGLSLLVTSSSLVVSSS